MTQRRARKGFIMVVSFSKYYIRIFWWHLLCKNMDGDIAMVMDIVLKAVRNFSAGWIDSEAKMHTQYKKCDQ